MGLKKLGLFIFISFLFFQGCSNKNIYSEHLNKKVIKGPKYTKLHKALSSQYKEWKGVKYKYGGYSKKGIDCSAFVQRTFKEKLNINIPRTTALQSEYGQNIPINDLKIGDLIFFKTGFKSRHVGIYLENGKFLHASTKRGVTISRLDNIYYSKHFWKIKRVLD